MNVIYKYEMTAIEPIKTFEFPRTAEVVHVDSQEPGTLQFWVELEPEMVAVERTFVVYGTGHYINTGDVYVGTALDSELPLVWHLYERKSYG